MKRTLTDLVMEFIFLLAVGAILWVHATVLSPYLMRHGSSSAFDLAIGLHILITGVFVFLAIIFYCALIDLFRAFRYNRKLTKKKEV